MSEHQNCLGPRCAEEDEPRRRTHGYLCRRCYTQLEQTIHEMPSISTWLGLNLSAGQGGKKHGDIITGTRERPLPIRASVFDQQAEIVSVLLSWVRLVCEERDLRGPDRGDVNATSAWLGHQLDWCSQQLWIDDLAREMRELAKDAHQIAPWRPGRHHLPEPCPNPDCGRVGALVRYDGDSQIQCSECGERWPETHYRRLVEILASDARQRQGPACVECQHQSCWELRAVQEVAA